jgi:DNA invertase Pin-like site-specific DNA recombinase
MSSKVCILARVSTKGQAKSGLSIAHQLDACARFCKANNLEVVETFIEVGSGGIALERRPVLKKALATCERHNARLVVNKLSRLSRKVSFIAGLLDKQTRFFITEMGFREVSTFELHLIASFAQLERERISQRTREGLAKSKKKSGNPNPRAAITKGHQTIQKNKEAFNRQILPVIIEIKESGVSTASGIAECLNRRGIKGRRGGRFQGNSVIRILKDREEAA